MSKQTRIKQIRGRRNNLIAARKRLSKVVAGYTKTIGVLNRRLRRLLAPSVPPMNPGGWHPLATQTQSLPPLSFAGGKPKLVWHTTQGRGLPQYRPNSQPHFTLNPQTGELWQHVPIRGGAYGLENASGGVETNRANCIQVELIGFAEETQDWSDAAYRRIGLLARWIEKHAGVPRSCGVDFLGIHHSMSAADWNSYSGHCGHQHVPENFHWDPGRLDIKRVLA